MRNIDIIEQFESEEMSKFLASVAMQNWDNWKRNKKWLEKESEDGNLRSGYMIWQNMEWVFDKENRNKVFWDNWVLAHLPDILEFIMAQGKIKTANVLVVIPTIECGHRFDDYKDIINYKGINFHIWSDFFDYRQEDIISPSEGEEDYKRYLTTYNIVNFMRNLDGMVNTIKIYFKDK